jgi:hypothetical protein
MQRRRADDMPDDSSLKKLAPRKVKVPPKTKSEAEVSNEHEHEQLLSAPQPHGVILSFERPEGWPENDEYVCEEDERPVNIAKKMCVNADKLVTWNRLVYPTLNKTVPLKAGTRLRLPPPLGSLADQQLVRAEWWEPCSLVVQKLKKTRQADPFLSAVDWEELGLVDYPFIVTNPMDLGTVEDKLNCDMYKSAAQVHIQLAEI